MKYCKVPKEENLSQEVLVIFRKRAQSSSWKTLQTRESRCADSPAAFFECWLPGSLLTCEKPWVNKPTSALFKLKVGHVAEQVPKGSSGREVETDRERDRTSCFYCPNPPTPHLTMTNIKMIKLWKHSACSISSSNIHHVCICLGFGCSWKWMTQLGCVWRNRMTNEVSSWKHLPCNPLLSKKLLRLNNVFLEARYCTNLCQHEEQRVWISIYFEVSHHTNKQYCQSHKGKIDWLWHMRRFNCFSLTKTMIKHCWKYIELKD